MVNFRFLDCDRSLQSDTYNISTTDRPSSNSLFSGRISDILTSAWRTYGADNKILIKKNALHLPVIKELHKQTLRQLNLVERDDNDSILKWGKIISTYLRIFTNRSGKRVNKHWNKRKRFKDRSLQCWECMGIKPNIITITHFCLQVKINDAEFKHKKKLKLSRPKIV